jgi:DNA gyrase subunit B
MADHSGYTAESIQILEGLEAVRKRPAMYIGDTGKRGLHHLVYEVLDNSIDEHLAGYGKNIGVTIHNDGSVSVMDEGRGVPVERHASGKSALEVVMTILHAGGKFEKNAYKVSGGLHGVGVSVVNALSDEMSVEVHRDGKVWLQTYAKGIPQCGVKAVGDTNRTGTTVRFKPDGKIFQTTEFEYNYLRERIMELAFLNAGLKIVIKDERTGQQEEFHYEGGIKQFVEHLNKSRGRLHPPFYIQKTTDSVEIQLSMQYTDGYSENIYSFVNDIKTIEGGTHVAGFKSALTRVINDYVKGHKSLKEDKHISGDDVLEGLTAIISIKIPEPQFEGQTKTKLGNAEVKGIVDSLAYDSLKTYMEENPHDSKAMIQKVMSSMEAREAAQKAKDLIRRKSVFESSILPGKLADCEEKDPAKSEIFLVEGDSAGGSSKQSRDRRHQAILPLKGKILNVEKAPLHKVLSSEEIRAIVLSVGAGFGDDFDLAKCRYHKIIIASDADVDGSHIRTLILTLFYRHFKPIIEKGYLYIATPPLYRIKTGKTIRYAYSDQELQEVLRQIGEKADIQRYKGLGEMNPEQLWETTMDPERRTLKRVNIEDGMEADALFSVLMGEEVEPRKEFIVQYAKQVKNLDI